MAAVSAADSGDVAGVAGGGEPVANGGPNGAALHRPVLALRRPAGDQEQQSRAGRDRLVEPAVEQIISGGEIVAVEIDGEIRLDEPLRQAAVPAGVESGAYLRLFGGDGLDLGEGRTAVATGSVAGVAVTGSDA